MTNLTCVGFMINEGSNNRRQLNNCITVIAVFTEPGNER